MTYSRSTPLEQLQDRKQRNIRLTGAREDTVNDLKHSLRLPTVDERVRSIEVAERLLETISLSLEDPPVVTPRPRAGNGQTELERHVEPRHSVSGLGPTEIMDRVPALTYELKNSIETTLRCGQLECCAWPQSLSANPGDRSEEKLFVRLVVRNVEENLKTGRRQIRPFSASGDSWPCGARRRRVVPATAPIYRFALREVARNGGGTPQPPCPPAVSQLATPPTHGQSHRELTIRP